MCACIPALFLQRITRDALVSSNNLTWRTTEDISSHAVSHLDHERGEKEEGGGEEEEEGGRGGGEGAGEGERVAKEQQTEKTEKERKRRR